MLSRKNFHLHVTKILQIGDIRSLLATDNGSLGIDQSSWKSIPGFAGHR